MTGKRRPLLDILDAGELLATLRRERDTTATTTLTLTRPYGLTVVRRVARILTGRSQPLSASREDLAHAIEQAMNDRRPARTRLPGRRRRNTSVAACRAALTKPLAS